METIHNNLSPVSETSIGLTPITASTTTSTEPIVKKDSADNTTSMNGSMDPLAQSHRNIELQNALEKQSKELAESRIRLNEVHIKLKDSDERYQYADDKINSLNKDLMNSMETCKKLQRDLKDAIQQKEDQEKRLSVLEQKYVNAQRECSSLTDLSNRLETELAIRESSLKHVSLLQLFFCSS
jgi:chromosome segregation ATPase